MSLRDAFRKVVEGVDLTSEECESALDDVIENDAPPALLAGFLIALRMKGENAEELAGLARTMRIRAVRVEPAATGLVDTCGTGGDGMGTANISTAAAFVVAGAGLPVAKHGNRALSSKAGSADVLEALGVRLDLTAEQVARCIDEAGIGFIFAPAFHPAMAKVMPVRRELGVRTAFNLLGPLTNPARPSFQLVGVGDGSLVPIVAGALATLGVERAYVVHGSGTDELVCGDDNIVLRVEGGEISRQKITARDAGLHAAPLSELAGGTPEENAQRLQATLAGEPGPVLDAVLLNAGTALLAAGAAETIRDAVVHARDVIDSGRASEALERLVDVGRDLE